MANEQAAVEEFVTRYFPDPCLFVSEVLGATPDKKQAEVMQAVAAGCRRISVRSGHGVGKSTMASWLMLWFMLTRYPQKTVVTAPTSSQLYDALYAELKRWAALLPKAVAALIDVRTDRVELRADPAGSFISARTSRAEQPEALQGVHSEHVLLVVDEASGVPEAIFEAASGSMSGHSATTILLGNPVRSSGLFYDSHNRLAADWKTFHISCLDSPRVSPEFVREMATRYGEDSNSYRIRVLGEFPKGDDDTLIPMELVTSAQARDVAPVTNAPIIWGFDVARFGNDRCALAERQGNILQPLRHWRGLDLMQTTGAIVHEYESRPVQMRPAEICVDSIGIGAGVVDRLRELGLPVIGINVSESPAVEGESQNLRTELWVKMKTWLAARDCRIPADRDLEAELATPKYRFTSNGRIMLESKDDMRRRGIPSPDLADAFALTFAGMAATALHGGGWRGRGKALKRNTPGIV